HPLSRPSAGLLRVRTQGTLHTQYASSQDHALDPRRCARHGPQYRHERCLFGLTSPAKEGRDALRSPQTHPEAGPLAPARSQRSERRVPPRRRSPEPAQNGQDDPATEPRTGLMEEADMLVRYSQSRADRPRTHFFNRIVLGSDKDVTAAKGG